VTDSEVTSRAAGGKAIETKLAGTALGAGQVPLPAALAEIAEDFLAMSARDRLTLLLDFSDGLPELPERYVGHSELLERVEECQSPLFLVVEVEGTQDVAASTGGTGSSHDGTTPPDGTVPRDATVHLFFQAPPEAPTTRGFAGILHEGLDGLNVGEVLAVPDDAPYRFGLGEAVSPLRLRGMVAMLSRIKRQVRARSTTR
jgi:cysteine desulfuration protein SufE